MACLIRKKLRFGPFVDIRSVLLLIVILPVGILAGEARNPGGKIDREKAKIVRLEHEWLRAEQTGDVDTLNVILANDMLRPNPAGADFIGKKKMIEHARSKRKPIRAGQPVMNSSKRPSQPRPRFSELRVWIYGNAAIARGVLTIHGTQGKLIGKSLFTDVFIRRHGRWQAVSAQENDVSGR